MPGAVLHNVGPADVSATRVASAANNGGGMDGTPTAFLVWLMLLGVILPVLILGGLKIGGFSFVFRNR